MTGLGACLAIGLLVTDALLAVLAGNAAGATAHAVSHLVDRELGGHPGDPALIGLVALGLIVLSAARRLSLRR